MSELYVTTGAIECVILESLWNACASSCSAYDVSFRVVADALMLCQREEKLLLPLELDRRWSLRSQDYR